MGKRNITVLPFIILATLFMRNAKAETANPGKEMYRPIRMDQIQKGLSTMKTHTLAYSDKELSENEKNVINQLAHAGRWIDEIYLEQIFPKNRGIFSTLKKRYSANPKKENRQILEYFWINKGPYDLFAEFKPFLTDVPPEMDVTRNFYPDGLTKEAFEKWHDSLTDPKVAQKAKADFTLIQGSPPKDLKVVPYSKAYERWLLPLSSALEKTAKIAAPSLSKFLRSRSRAFQTNDYEASEALWIDLNGPEDKSGGHIDVTIGPYENYADELNKYKAGFQFYVGVLRSEKTRTLQLYRSHVHTMDEHLWTLYVDYVRQGKSVAPNKSLEKAEATSRWRAPGSKVTLVAVDLAYAAGMANEGYQTLAFNLPNVSAWSEKYGTKKVMLMNVLDGKFKLVLEPIAKKVIASEDLTNVDLDMFSENTVRHEVAHGIGPGTITVKGETTTVRDRLKSTYSAFEEAKAEIVSLLLGYFLVEKGHLKDETFVKRMATTYVASVFRTIRFGSTSDHAKGKVFEFNRLTQNEGILFDEKTQKYRVNHEKFREAVEKLAVEIIDIQMRRTEVEAKKLLDDVGKPTPELTASLSRINQDNDIPVDIRVAYTVGENYSVIKK